MHVKELSTMGDSLVGLAHAAPLRHPVGDIQPYDHATGVEVSPTQPTDLAPDTPAENSTGQDQSAWNQTYTMTTPRTPHEATLATLTAAVFANQRRHPWPSSAMKIHEQLVEHYRKQAARLGADGPAIAPHAEATGKALAVALRAFAIRCDAEQLPAKALAAS
jgi:hypothetical protein